jgi:hypothetical protein
VSAVQALTPDLWRWTSPHPLWRPGMEGPGGWERDVASVAVRAGDRTILVDPLIEGDWAALDDVVAGKPVVILLTAAWHERSSAAVAERYAAEVLVHETGLPRLKCRAREMPMGEVVPGVEALPVPGDEGEVVLWLSTQRALVSAEVLTGSSEGLRIAESPLLQSRDELRAWIAALARLPVEMVLPSHGPPVLENGRDAIAAALDQPPW